VYNLKVFAAAKNCLSNYLYFFKLHSWFTNTNVL